MPNNGLVKVNLEMAIFRFDLEMAIFRFDLENEISVCVRNWELKTWVLKPRLGLTAEFCRKPKTNNQQLLRN